MTDAKVALLTGPRSIELTRHRLPDIGDDDGVLRIEACGICGADVPPWRSGVVDGHDTVVGGPAILGHEFVGRFERIGWRAAERWGVGEGDRVVLERAIPCGRCDVCYAGDYRVCTRTGAVDDVYRYGSTPITVAPGLWGGYAEYMYVHPDSVVYRAPENVAAELVAFFTPLANGLSWMADTAAVRIGETVLVEGPGQQGIAAVVGASMSGAGRIIVAGLRADAGRLRAAERLGATDVITVGPDEPPLAAQVAELTGGRGADVVLDATSGRSTQPVESAIEAAGDGGRIVLSSHHEGALSTAFDVRQIWRKRLQITGVRSRSRWAVKAALELLGSDRYDLASVPHHTVGLDDLERGLRLVGREDDDVETIHVTVVPA